MAFAEQSRISSNPCLPKRNLERKWHSLYPPEYLYPESGFSLEILEILWSPYGLTLYCSIILELTPFYVRIVHLFHRSYDIRRSELIISGAPHRPFECCAILQESECQSINTASSAVLRILESHIPVGGRGSSKTRLFHARNTILRMQGLCN
jgi:hypothetical protein